MKVLWSQKVSSRTEKHLILWQSDAVTLLPIPTEVLCNSIIVTKFHPVYNSEFRMIVSLSGGRASLASVEPGVGQGQVWKKGRKKWRKGLISEIYLFCRHSSKRASQWSRRFPPYLSEIHTSWSFISRTIQASRLLWHRSLWQNAYGDGTDSSEFKNEQWGIIRYCDNQLLWLF